MLADACYPGMLSKAANAPSLGAYVRSKWCLGFLISRAQRGWVANEQQIIIGSYSLLN